MIADLAEQQGNILELCLGGLAGHSLDAVLAAHHAFQDATELRGITCERYRSSLGAFTRHDIVDVVDDALSQHRQAAGLHDMACAGAVPDQCVSNTLGVLHQFGHDVTRYTGSLCHRQDEDLPVEHLIDAVAESAPDVLKLVVSGILRLA